MKRFLYLLIILLSTGAWTQRDPLPLNRCSNFNPPGYIPGTRLKNKNIVPICRQGYYTEVDIDAKIPSYVSYVLTPEHSTGCIARSNAFARDNSLTKDKSASPTDYAHSGYDIGHMSPDGDNAWDKQVELESFLLTNMCPQLPGFNRGIWKLLESHVRAWALERNHDLIIISGPVYDIKKDQMIGSGIDVPSGFYKIIIDTKTNESLAFLFPHKENLGKDLSKFITNVRDIESKTGILFHIASLEDKELWPVDLGQYTKTKKKICK